jgi:hypothetical protein
MLTLLPFNYLFSFKNSKAPFRKLIPYSIQALRQAKKLAQPSVFPFNQLIPSGVFSQFFSVTVTSVLSPGLGVSVIFPRKM